MDWKREAEEELRNYKRSKNAIEMLEDDIAATQAAMSKLGCAYDSVRVSSSTSADDKILHLIVKKDALIEALEKAKRNISAVDKGLAMLTEEEAYILTMFYITPAKHNVEKICEELCCEQATVYRKRYTALRHYTISRYGCMEI